MRGLKQLFTPYFLLIGKKSKIINNYCIAHQKNHVKIAMTEVSTNSGLNYSHVTDSECHQWNISFVSFLCVIIF